MSIVRCFWCKHETALNNQNVINNTFVSSFTQLEQILELMTKDLLAKVFLQNVFFIKSSRSIIKFKVNIEFAARNWTNNNNNNGSEHRTNISNQQKIGKNLFFKKNPYILVFLLFIARRFSLECISLRWNPQFRIVSHTFNEKLLFSFNFQMNTNSEKK